MTDSIGAFVPGTDIRVEGAAEGPLTGLTFAAKDLFDVAGYPTGGGNHDWPTGRAVPTRNAWAVQRLLDGGATLVGKTVTDEVSLGILGESAFDGTPVNVNAPGRVPGGSSSGSAAAVAAGLCDTALGTDTGGSVRVPSSFCGLYGIRPTHGRLPVDGMMTQAPTSDTTGWFARDAATFAKVSAHLLDEAIPTDLPTRLLVTTDTFAFAEDAVAEALAPLVDRLAELIGAREDVLLAPQGLSVWARAQRTIQPREAYETFKPWIDTNPRMAFGVARGLMQGAAVTETELGWANQMRREARGRLKSLLPAGTILCLPTTPFPAPPTGLSISQQTPLRELITCLCAFGGLAGRPQVSIPGATVDGLPIGLSIVGGPGTDAALIAVARALESHR
ncbi:amidase [Thalassobaculum litoreum]|uniref:Amidase n=1 Tax=Thalassobaculum litoreum DSM 18839 TaxID=1123362 RepID=A0A8G2BF70_9PROT|nr:amidase [Thalassobaculum litoreum]SDF17535.1 amidase [Thalassobaculum litoreum DSM 18839]